MVDYDGNYANYYLVDTMTGERKPVLEKLRAGGRFGGGGITWSPDGHHVLFFKEHQWHTLSVPEGKETDLTGRLAVRFDNEEHDSPNPAESYGTAGWTKDGKALVYDRYDVWQISADGASAKNVTGGVGRRDKLQFRVVRLDRAEEATEEDRGVDPTKPLLLRAENMETHDSGIWEDRLDRDAPPRKLLMGPANYRPLLKAHDADVVVVTAQTFHDEPDLRITDSTFRDLRRVTTMNPQKEQIRWGTAELVSFKNTDGLALQAALYKPEGFDPSKKYPMIVYIYERLSQNVNNFVAPRPGHSINISYYVSNGYLVLTPDIAYSIGYPGPSALKCVLPAVEAVVDRGFVNENAIGIQGHSWGGYQIAYMVTQTNRFRAAEAGAPVANMISAYNGIRWGSGLPRQFQYEQTQSRIGGSPWQYPLRFIENSPVFHADRIETPLLILHNDGDDAVPWYQGVELFLSLRRLGKEAYLFDYNGEPHGLRKRQNQKDYAIRMQQFFDHFLKGAPAPEWMEKGIPYIDREKEKERFGKATDQ
jgi:dipeptidyl aminopeptidase/acylaminoacyl peptidase